MRSALLVVDVQQGMFLPPTPAFQGEAVVERISGLLARARAQGLPVIHVQHDGGPGDVLARGSPGWKIHPGITLAEDEPIIEKRYCNAFQQTDLGARLTAAGIERVIVAGLQTEFCIDTTCRAAMALGLKVVLIADGHTTFDTPELSAAQIIAHHNRTLEGGGFCELQPAASVRLSARHHRI